MNSAKTLYWILNVIIFLLLIGICLGIFFFAMVLFGIKQDFVNIYEGVISFKTDKMLYVFTILKLVVYIVFIASLLKLRESIKLLLNKDFYKIQLIITLFSSGKLMVITGVFSGLIDIISNVFFKINVSAGFSEEMLVYLLVIAIGFFLMLISTVLKDAKTVKDEHNLTI